MYHTAVGEMTPRCSCLADAGNNAVVVAASVSIYCVHDQHNRNATTMINGYLALAAHYGQPSVSLALLASRVLFFLL